MTSSGPEGRHAVRARLAAKGWAAALALLAACGGEPAPAAASPWPVVLEPEESGAPRYERIVLVTIDTLRADHVSCYGYPRETTPFLDSLAARGARFAHTIATVSHTAPSHSSMLTGLVPAVHGVLVNGQELAPEALDVAKIARAAGLESGAFLNASFLAGVAGSFDRCETRSASGASGQEGDAVVDAALSWISAPRRSERFFLWVHLYDPHDWQRKVRAHWDEGPFWSGETPPGFVEHVLELHGLPLPVEGQEYRIEWGVKSAQRPADAAQEVDAFRRCIDQYDELVRFSDSQVARLYAGIQQRFPSGGTLWIVTADHGEGLASHRYAGHGSHIYQEQLSVPLVVHASDDSIAARVVETPVAHIDLLPTLAQALGRRVRGDPSLYEGRSLWPFLDGTPPTWGERFLFSQRRPIEGEEDRSPPPMYALQSERGKLILTRDVRAEFYDLGQDPRELHNLGGENAEAERMREALEDRLRRYDAHALPVQDEAIPADWLEELRDLGYTR